MSKKVNFSMANADAVARIQNASDAVFAHAMESVALAKTIKNAKTIVENALKEGYDGEIAKLRDAIREDESKVDTAVVEALKTINVVGYKRTVLATWYKDEIEKATVYFGLDDIVDELGTANTTLEKGVEKVDAILTNIFGLDKVAVQTRRKFARKVYSAMDGQKKSSNTATTKGTLLKDRARREIKEVGIRAMCEYVAKTANITLKTREDYGVTATYDANFTKVEFEYFEV